MGVFRIIGYGLVGLTIAGLWSAASVILSTLASMAGIVLVGAAAVGFAGYLIQERREQQSDQSPKTDH